MQDDVTSPAQHSSSRSPLTEAEWQQIVIDWNNTQTSYGEERGLHVLFAAQAAQQPDALAVVFDPRTDQSLNLQLTYRELNRRANQLARRLRRLGIGTDDLVGVCLERSAEMVIALLGVLKAGGAYVPLDPTYPRDRLTTISDDARVPVILTQSWLVASLPQHTAHIICLDTAWTDLASEQDTNPASTPADDRLAYVIYTSGSTGRPKGVMNSQRGILNRLLWGQAAYQLTPSDRLLQKTPFSFDVSVGEFFWPLTTGACLVLAQPEGHKDSAYIVRTILEQQITTVHFVPSMFQIIVREPELETCRSLRRVMCSGEALPLDMQKRFWTRLATGIHNLYGPTEAAIEVTYWDCTAQSPYPFVPIGRPIANTQIYLLDAALQPVPIGEPGELCIGGIGLARGYFNRPDLTAERFVPHPFSSQPGARLYRTGDLARYLPDGNIEFLGRLDFQVKVRGFRIELGEIEAALRQHPVIRDAVVVAQESGSGDKRLVAYVAADLTQLLATAELRAWLGERLPEYMVPAVFVRLDHLPLTPSGKVDRKALPQPDEVQVERSASYAPPRTPLEETLAEIWSTVLGTAPIGVHDHFLDLGGHSLLALRIILAIREQLGIELTLDHLFRLSTIETLAASLEVAQHAPGMQSSAVERVPRDRALPLSSQQLQLWFLAQLYPDWPVYNEPYTLNLHQPIDVAAFECGLAEMIRRHEILRTTYAVVDEQPVQIIHPPDQFSLPFVDLTGQPEDSREAEALRFATVEARRPFDLEHGPLCRYLLIKLAEADYRLFVTMHHSMMDGITLYQIFFLELQQLYQAYLRGAPSPLPDLDLQYADYAVWQRRHQAQVQADQLAYWRKQLADGPVLQLPTDRPRPPQPSFRGAYQRLALSKALTEQLKTLARQTGVTLFVTLSAAIQTLLYRYTGQDDIALGTFTAGRHRPEIGGLMGDFLNTIVLRTRLDGVSGQPTFRALLQRVHHVTAEAYAHQDIPFDQLVAALQPDRQLGQNALFRVSFVIEPPLPEYDLPWTLSQMDVQTGTSKFDLGFELDDRAEGIIGRIEYNTDLFDADTITRMIGHLQFLLQGIVDNPDRPLADLPLLSAAERVQLLDTWNDTRQADPPVACFHELVWRQAECRPDAVALTFDDQAVTYGELQRRAEQLAQSLQGLGVGPEDVIGLCMERSPAMIIGLLAIHTAGAAYVPLDPALPAARLTFTLEETQAKLVLTQVSLKSMFVHEAHAIPAMCIDEPWPVNTLQRETPQRQACAQNLAYIIFTSGSTGNPKGVLVSHQGLNNFASEQARIVGVDATSRVLQFSSMSFDASVSDIVMALAAGATLCLGTREALLPGPSLARLLREQAITIMTLTPSALAALPAEEYPALRSISVAGEACPAELITRWASRVRFTNLYGPTETTIWATQAHCLPGTLRPSIGRPIHNVQIYLLDDQLQPVPIGVSGEIYIGGIGVTRGYLNNPDRTAVTFVPHPFSAEPGTRLYKTGDLARYLTNGDLEYLGRVDQQVKIRGYRIELGEIEACLRQHPAVHEAVVIAYEPVSETGQLRPQQLATYLVPADSQPMRVSELRNFVKERLPEYMMPAAFIVLDQLPLTTSGKVDRRALPVPNVQQPLNDETYVAPRTPVEQTLTEIWATLLGLPRVGVHDDFFEAGGHSLLVTQLITRTNEAFQIALPIRAIFERPNIAQLAELVVSKQLEQVESEMLAQLLAQIEELPDDEAAGLLFAIGE
jgi:surfactin family lipopeptide synthetase A